MEILKNFSFSLQRHAVSDGDIFYTGAITSSTDADFANMTTTDPSSAAPADGTKFYVKVEVAGSGTSYTVGVTSYKAVDPDGDGTYEWAEDTTHTWAGKVITNALTAANTYTFNSTTYKLDASALEGSSIITGFSAGDKVGVAGTKTITVGGKTFTAAEDSTFEASTDGTSVMMLTGGSVSVTNASLAYGTSGHDATNTVTIKGTATLASAGNITDIVASTEVSDLAEGATVTNDGALDDGSKVTVNTTEFTLSGDHAAAAFIAAVDSDELGRLAKGTITGAANKTYNLIKENGSANGESVVVGKGTTVTITAADGVATVKGLDDEGESVTISSADGLTSRTYTYVTDTIVKVTGTDVDAATQGKYFTYDDDTGCKIDTTLNAATTSPIETGNARWRDAKTYSFNEIGVMYSSGTSADADAAAVLVTSSSGNKTLTVYKEVAGVDMSTDSYAVTVTDKGTGTEYTVDTKSVFTASGGQFTSTEGVLSSVTGTIALVEGTEKLTAKGTANIDATNASDAVLTYNAGADINKAKITLTDAINFTLTESNSGSDAVSTVIDLKNKEITGLEGDATITSVGLTSDKIATIQTTGNGSFTFGKTAYVVAEESDGVTFTLDDTTADTISEIAGLDQDATITIASKLSDVDMTVNTTEFTDITSKTQTVFTGSKSDKSEATIALFAKNDSVVIGTQTYEVEAVGGASDGIVIGDNTFAALNDGDKVKVYATNDDTDYYEYEVSGSVMVVKHVDGTDVTTSTYTLSDASDAGFTVGVAFGEDKINGDKGVDTETVTFGTGTDTQTTSSLTDGIYVNADGTTTTSDKKAVAKVSIDNDVVTYTSMSSKGQTVDVTAGSDNWAITTGTGKDTIGYAGDGDANIDAGGGNDEIALDGSGDKVVNTGDGKNFVGIDGSGDVNLTLGNGKDTVTDNGSTGDVVITATGGNNVIDMSGKGTRGDVTIIGGSGNDTITASSEDDAVSGGAGADTFDITAKDVTISDYTFGDDVLQVSTTDAASVSPTMLSADGKVSVSNGGTADISANAGDFYAATLVNGSGKTAKNVAWAKEGGSNINTTSFSKDVLVKGDADGVNTLYTGAGDDFIYSYADNDSVFGGEGKDSIILQTGNTGRVVGIATNSSKDAVSGFTAGFSDSDSIYMIDGDVSGVKTTLESVSGGTGKFTFKDGAASLTLGSVGVNTVTGAAEILVNGFKLAALAAGATAKVDDANYADIYMGDKSTVDFSAVDGDLFVDLSNGLAGSSAGAKYVGVNAVTGGTGNSTLMGTGSADYIVATSGKTSLFGGAGRDTLVGNSNSADVFFFGDGTGSNTINNFTTQGNDNADTLQVYSNITGAKLNGSNVEISTADGSKAILTSQNANSKLNVVSTGFTGVAKVGSASSANNFTYDNDVTYYGGGSASDKIAFSSGYTDNAEIWMNGIQGKSYASIDVVDGTNTSGSLIVAGDSASQSIIGGKGDTSLWGGAGSATDTLRSSSGSKTMFWWGAGDGNDVVVSASSDDSVNLYNVKLSDINSANSSITNSGVVLALNDGSKLTMQTTRNMTFSIEGQSWTADQSSKEWKQNS